MSWRMFQSFNQQRLWWCLGSLSAASAVICGALGSHAWKHESLEYQKTFEKAVNYHFFHSFGLILSSIALNMNQQQIKQPKKVRVSISGALFAIGNILFCGSLYVVGYTGDRSYGKLAPFGGTCFILGWICLAFQL